WISLAALVGLAACGGGGGGGDSAPPPVSGAPAIQEFQASAPTAFVGERVTLTARFTGGTGRIEPDIGAVASGVAVQTPVLDVSRIYTLIVEAPGQPTARRELALPVNVRDRYTPLNAPFQVQYHAAVTAGDGSVLVIGGSRGQSLLSDAVDRFDPATRTFTRIGTLQTGRADHTATRTASGRILVLGGLISLNIGNVADVIDERTGAVTSGGKPVQGRNRHAAVALADGRVLVVGGFLRSTVELWDPATGTFRLVTATMQHWRASPTATLLADGRVLIVGGYSDAQNYTFAELFDPRTETFTKVDTAFSTQRALHEAYRLRDGKVLIVGGETPTAAGDDIVPLANVLVFDPASNSFTQDGELEQARTLIKGALLPGDEVLLFGGETAAEVATPTAAAYASNKTPRARPIAQMPVGRAWHTVSRMGDGRVLILGGDDKDGGPVTAGYVYE
ncbi:MAG: Kelch repeat-containing protein, partial [Burkholderiaceae bacterium]